MNLMQNTKTASANLLLTGPRPGRSILVDLHKAILVRGPRIATGIIACVCTCLLTALGPGSAFANSPNLTTGPTEESALAAEQEIARALVANDADAVGRLLADDWVVVSTHGGMADRAGFLEAIRSGNFTRKTMDLSEPRVKIYGNVAVVTARVKVAGTFVGKPFDGLERQTDVLIWQDGGWKSVLTQESELRVK
jgi:ketosteroid isomerase-like protein